MICQAYSPLGSPGSWLKGEILKEPILVEIAEKLNKSPAQVALRWGAQSGHSVLPKSVNVSRIKENLSLFDWSIPQELFSKFSGIHQVNLVLEILLLVFVEIFCLLMISRFWMMIHMQQRLLRGDFAIHESLSPYKSLQELWAGEI